MWRKHAVEITIIGIGQRGSIPCEEWYGEVDLQQAVVVLVQHVQRDRHLS
jgi:hypothetical protein